VGETEERGFVKVGYADFTSGFIASARLRGEM
jgi:hypothetical protein